MPQSLEVLDDEGNPIKSNGEILDDNGNPIEPPIKGILSSSHSQENLYTVPQEDDDKWNDAEVRRANPGRYPPKDGSKPPRADHAMEIVRGGLGTSETIDKLRNYSADKIGMDPYPLKGLRAGLSSMSTEPLRMIGELINDPLALATGVGAVGRGFKAGMPKVKAEIPKISTPPEVPIPKTAVPPIIDKPVIVEEAPTVKPAKKLTLKKQAQEDSLNALKTKIEQEYLDDSGNVIKPSETSLTPPIPELKELRRQAIEKHVNPNYYDLSEESERIKLWNDVLKSSKAKLVDPSFGPQEGPKATTNVQEFIDGTKNGTIPKGTNYSDYLKSKETPSAPIKEQSLTERLKSEEGSIVFKNPKNVDPKTADNVRNSLVESLMSGGRIDQDLIFKKVGGKLNRNQFNKIVDEILEKPGAVSEIAEKIKSSIPQQTPEAQSALKKLANSIIGSKGLREEQEAIYTAEKGRRIGRFGEIKTRGEKGASQRMKELKGEYEKLDIEEMTLNPVERDSLFNAITDSPIDKFEKARAYNAMWKLLNGGHVPQRGELEILNTIFGKRMGLSTGPGAASEFEELTNIMSEAADIPNPSASIAKDEPGLIRQIWDLPRGLKSMDFPFLTSATWRQGAGYIGTRNWFKSVMNQAKTFGSEETFNVIEAQTRSNPVHQSRITWDSEKGRSINASIADQAGVKLNDMSLRGRDVQIRSNLLERIPLIKQTLGRYSRASNRSFTTMMNSLKTYQLETMVKAANIVDEMGNITDIAKLRRIGNTINELTGSSNLDISMPILGRFKNDTRKFELEKSAEQLGLVLFSPKLMMRDARMMNPLNYMKNDKLVKLEYLKGALRRASAWAAFTTGAAVGLDASVNWDEDSSDFGKPRIGDTRADFGAGLLQWMVLLSREATGYTTPTDSKRRVKLGSSSVSGTRQSKLIDFMINKLSPNANVIAGALGASRNRPFYPLSTAVEQAIPMYTEDMIDLMTSDPEMREIILGLTASAMSAGSQTYGKDDLSKPSFKIPGDVKFEGGPFSGRR